MADKFLEFFREEYDLKGATDEQLTGFIRESYPSLTNLLTSDQVAPSAPTLSGQDSASQPTGAVNWGTDYSFSRQAAAAAVEPDAPAEPEVDYLDDDDLFKVKRKDWRRREMPAMMQNWPESEVPEKYKTGPGQPDRPSPDDPRYWEWVGEIDWEATQAARMEGDPTDDDYGRKFVTKAETQAEQESWNMGTATSIQREKEKALGEGESWWAWTVERLPIAGGIFSANQLARTYEAGRRLENGEAYEGATGQQLYREDVEYLADYLAQMERADEMGMFKKAGDIVSRLPGFAVEFGASGGGFTWTRKGFEEGMEKLVGDRIKTKIKSQVLKKLGTAGLKSGGFIAGGLGQAALMPQMTLENFASIMAGDGIQISQDEKGELGAIFAEDDPSFGLALYEALAQTGVESISERMGFLLSAKTLSKIPGLKAVMARRWMKAKPGRTTNDLLDAVKERAAWNGIIGEIGEERFAEVGRAVTTRDKYPDRTAREWGEQILIEGMAFSVPALGRKTIDMAANRGERQLIKSQQNMIDHLVTETGNLEALMGTMPWAFEGKATPQIPGMEPGLTLRDPNQVALEGTMPWALEGGQDVLEPLVIEGGPTVDETASVDVPKPMVDEDDAESVEARYKELSDWYRSATGESETQEEVEAHPNFKELERLDERLRRLRGIPKAYDNTPDGGMAEVEQIAFLSGVHNENLQKSAAKRGDIGLMVTPSKAHLVTKGQAAGYPYVAIDNGKYSEKKKAWSAKKFKDLVDNTIANVGLDKILFAVAPDHVDIVNGKPVGNAARTLELFEEWEPELRKKGVPVAFVAQDGLQDRLDEIPWDKIDVLFIGGSDAFKLGQVEGEKEPFANYPKNWLAIIEGAQKRHIPIHVGRVNTGERLTGFSTDIGASTVDGTTLKFHPKNQQVIEGLLDEFNNKRLNWKSRDYPDFGRPPTEEELYEVALDTENIQYQEDLEAFWPARVRINEIRKEHGLAPLKPRPVETKKTPIEVTEVPEKPKTEELKDTPQIAKLRDKLAKAEQERDDYYETSKAKPQREAGYVQPGSMLGYYQAKVNDRIKYLNTALKKIYRKDVEVAAEAFIKKWGEEGGGLSSDDMWERNDALGKFATWAKKRGFNAESANKLLQKVAKSLKPTKIIDVRPPDAAPRVFSKTTGASATATDRIDDLKSLEKLWKDKQIPGEEYRERLLEARDWKPSKDHFPMQKSVVDHISKKLNQLFGKKLTKTTKTAAPKDEVKKTPPKKKAPPKLAPRLPSEVPDKVTASKVLTSIKNWTGKTAKESNTQPGTFVHLTHSGTRVSVPDPDTANGKVFWEMWRANQGWWADALREGHTDHLKPEEEVWYHLGDLASEAKSIPVQDIVDAINQSEGHDQYKGDGTIDQIDENRKPVNLEAYLEEISAVLQGKSLTTKEIFDALVKRGNKFSQESPVNWLRVILSNYGEHLFNLDNNKFSLKKAPKEEEAPTETEAPKEPPSSPTTLSLSGQKDWLTKEIERAIREVPKIKSLNARQLKALKDKDDALRQMNQIGVNARYGPRWEGLQNDFFDAIKRAKEYGLGISFEVPGDGTFTVLNQPKELKEFQSRVNKLFPSKKHKYIAPNLGPAKPKAIAALGKEKQPLQSFIKALFPLASKDDMRGNIMVVNSVVDGEVIVTNGKGLIRIKHPDAKAGQSWKVTKAKVEKVEQSKNLPKFEQVMHKAGAKIAGFDTAEFLHILNGIQALKTKSGLVGEKAVGEIGVRIYSGPNGWSLRATTDSKDEFQSGVEGEYITTVGANLLADMVTAARRLGEQYVTLHTQASTSGNANNKTNVSALIVQGDKFYGVLMPLKSGSALDSGPLKSVQDIGDAPMATHEQATLPRRIEAPRYDANRPGGDGKGQAVSLQEIRKFLAKALDIPIRLGVGRRSALGLFWPQRETIRMKALNNIPTVAHEVGHYLHYIMFPKAAGGHPGASNFDKQFDTELNKLGARTSRASYTEHQVRKEGVAEFVRIYLSDRAQALARAPKFHKFFQENLEKYPEINGILEQATDMIQTYVNQSSRLKVGSLMGGKGEKVAATVSEWLTGMHDKWVNELAPIERAIKLLEGYGLNVPADQMADQLAINYMGGWRGRVEHSLFQGQVNFNGEQVGPSLREVLGGVDDLYDFQIYLVAKRAIEKIKQGKEVGIDLKSVQEVVGDMQGKYEFHRQKLDKFLTNELAMLVEAGFLSTKEFNRIKDKNQDYVPFFRLHDRVGSAGGSGRGFIDLSKGGLKAFKGSDLQIHPPLESVVKNMYLFRDLAERNRVARAFVSNFMSTKGGGRVGEMEVRKIKPVQIHAEEIEAHLKSLGVLESKFQEGLPGADELLATQDLSLTVWRMTRTESAADGIFSVWKDGKQEYYMIKDPGLYTALKLMDSTAAEVMSRIPIMNVVKLSTRTLRAGATLTMEFMARNPWRDQVSAGIYSRHGFVPFFDGFRGMLSALKMDKYYWEWVNAQGKYADFMSMDAPSVSKKLVEVASWKQQTPREMWPLVKKWMNPMHSLRKASELMEMATRLQEFKRAKKKGKSDVEAANASKDITLNFTRFGLHGKMINQVTAFFNATVQDWNKLYREHKGPNKYGVMTKSMLYITVPSILTWWLGKDDEEIQTLPSWRKLGFWNINLKPIAKMAGVDLDKPGDFGIFNILPYPGMGDWVLSLPKPFLLGQLYGSSVEAALNVANDKDPEALYDWLFNLTRSSPLPVAIDPDVYTDWKIGPNLSLTPTLARPLAEAVSNKQLHTGRPLHTEAQKKLPGHRRFNPSTSEIMKALAESTAFYTDSWIDPSPIILDNNVKALTAGLGKYGLDYADYFFLKFRQSDVPIVKPEKTLLEKPVVRAFFKSPYEPSARVGQFYDAYRRMETRYNGIREMALDDPGARIIKREVPIAFHYEMPESPGGASRMQQLRAGRQAMSAFSKGMRAAQDDGSMTPREKADSLIELKNQRDDLAANLILLFHPKDVRNIPKKKLIPHKLLSLPVPSNAY